MFLETLDYLEKYRAGKYPEEISKKYGIPLNKIVSLKSNENPYPLPASIKKTIIKELSKISRYPNPDYPELKEKISSYTNLPPESIGIGNGANELLANLSKIFLEPFDVVAIPVPTYTMYILYAMVNNARLKFIETQKKGFKVRAEDILSHRAKLIFLCSPNNPTGATIDEKEIIKIVEESEAMVIVDETYSEFYGKSIANKVNDYDNLVVVRSFSKFFGLAGLRVGYALSNPKIINYLEKTRQPFALSTIAEKAAIKAIEEINYFMKTKEKIISEREYLFSALKKIEGLKPWPSKANFILVEILNMPASKLLNKLYSKGIIIRDVTGLIGLKGEYIRITVGRRKENIKLISAIKECFSKL